MPIIVYAPKANHLFGKKIQELQKKLISKRLLSVKFCHLQHEKTGSIALPQQEVILPSYPNSTLVPVVFLDFSSFREPGNTTLRLVFIVRGSLALMWRKIKETLWDQGTLTVSEQSLCSSCSNGLQGQMADKPSGWNRQ